MITNFFIPELNNHDVQELWFQQDGATCRTARATIDLLKDTFDVLEAKREEFVDDALIYAVSCYEELEISFEPPRRIRRKHIFGNGGKDTPLLYEDDLRSEVIVSMYGLNLDQAPQDINKEEFQLERVRLQAFVAATDPGCKKRTH
ncbi:uncharacterized protein TNCV_1035931 [Trichonephila clavipes]|nr:uncharacterized protein TNCV_1035931 [Trichonephila clavipes]